MAGAWAKLGKERESFLNREEQRKKNTSGALASYGKQRKNEANQGGIVGGAGYIVGNLGLGFAGIGEGVGDLISAGGDLLRGDTEMAKYRFLDNKTAEIQRDLKEQYNPGSVMEFAGDVASGIGQSSVFLLDAVAPGVGTGLFFAGVGGQGISSAAAQTGDVGWKEFGYGVASGVTEGLLEKAMGAGSKVAGKLGASITRKAGTAIGQKSITTALTKSAGKRAWSSIAKATAKDAAGEFAEEFASEYIDTALLHAFGIDPNASTSFGEAVRAGMVGLFSGGIMGAPGNVINYKNAAKAGRTIRESGETENLLNRAQATVSVLREQEAVKKAEGKKVKKTDEGTEAAEQKGFLERQGAKREARRAAEYAAKLEKNVNAYRNMKEEMRNSEVGDALLGELRGNLYFTNMAYAVEEAEIVLRNVDDAQAKKIVDYINTEAKKAKQEKSDYTVEDFRLNRDGILSQFAAKGRMEQLVNGEWTEAEEMAAQAAEATESPVETAGAAGAVTGEEVGTPVKKTNEKAVWTNPGTTEDEKAIYKVARDIGLSETETNMMLASFKKGTAMDADTFAKAYSEGIFRGRRGQNPADVTPGSLLASMNPYERQEAFEAGRTSAIETEDLREAAAKQKRAPARQADKQGKTSFVTLELAEGVRMRDLSPEAYQTYNAAKVIGEALHTDIVLHSTLGDVNGKKQNGYYNPKTGEIHIALDAGRGANGTALFTLAHEVTHYIKEWSPRKYQALSDFVSERISGELDVLVERKVNLLRTLPDYKNMTVSQLNDAAHEEVVADAMETVLSDGNVLEDLATYDNSIWQKVKTWITKAIKNIKAVYESLSPNSRAAQVLSETMTDMEKLERLFTEGVREAGERARTAGIKTVTRMNEENMHVIYSVHHPNFSESDIQKNMESIANMNAVITINAKKLEKTGKRPKEIFQDYFDRLGNNIYSPVYGDIALSNSSVKSEIRHGLTAEKIASIEAIADVIEKGAVIFHRAKENSDVERLVICAPIKIGADDYYMGVMLQRDAVNQRLYLHGVASVSIEKEVIETSQADRVTNGALEDDNHLFITSILQRALNVKREKQKTDKKFSVSENIPSTLSAEDQNLLFDADFYERYENESREPITETVEELEAIKASEAFATMSDDEAFDLNAKLKAKRAGYNTVYDYYVETEKERMGEEYRRYVQTGRSNRTSRTLEEKRKKAQKERTLRSDVDSATPLQNAQYQIIQETNPMWDEYHTGIRSPKEIKNFAEVAEDPDSFTWGDFTREDAQKALRDGTVRVYSSYAIKNGVFVSTSYKQALQYAGNNPDGVHTRVVALDSVAWINGDEGQYAKVYKDDEIRYSIDETTENADVSGNAADTNVGRNKAMTWDEAFGTAVTGSSFRQALAEALEKTIETDSEYKILKDYSESIARLNNLQKQIDELNATASALREKQFYSPSKEERSSAAKELQSIYERRRKLEDEMAKGDSRLERLRQTEPIRNIVRSAERAEKERSKAEEQYKSDRREMSVRERVARRVIGRLNTMFYSPSRTKHVPADLQALVEQVLKSEKLDTFKDTRKNLRQMAELERDIEKLEQNPARTASEQERLDKLHYKYAMLEDEGLDAKGQAEALYTAFKTWMESRPEGQQDKALLDKLSSEIDKMQEMPLSMMSKKSLEAVEDFYKMIYHQVNTANQIYTTERVLYVDDLGGKASQEAQETKSLKFLSPKAMEIKGKDSIRRFFWKNMKPLTVFEAIGSKTFTGLFQAVLDGEGVWAKDILEARAKIVEAREAHKYKDWDLEKRVEVKTKEGTVKLSLSERMSLYAYAKRAQAVSHLEGGGFVLDPKATTKEGKTIAGIAIEKRLNDSTRYVLDAKLMGEIESTLTSEQKKYVDEMQKYLTEMGKKGNEVSKKLYGMEIFKEEFYFPIKVKSEYLASQTGKTGDPNIKNRGMTKEVVPEAKDPLVLQGFDEVMADHINSMATYHAFVLPVEDLTRVLNYKPANYLKDENGEVILDDAGKPKADPDAAKDYSTLKAVIEDKYGEDAVKYIEQVIRDLNGGARRDAAAGILDRGLTAFKRASTMASLSVLVQQPTSLIRAAAYIDPKYLFGNATIIDFKNHKELWERVKKYAPVAVIKEMGGYDTGVGTRTADYLNATEYEKGERLKGFVKDENYRAEVFGRGAAYADEMAWIQMFEACVSEQADKMGKSRDSEEVLQAAGKRFEEVIRHTQVYDSTLTRSENMRSKDTGMKMATAFMAEPTTIVSMVAEAIMKAERGDKTFLRNTAAAVAGSIVINAIAASLVYALRDDDEDETYSEKYVSTLAMEVADGFNPLGYLPVARDVVSLMQGYEVERTDMALIGNLIEQVNMITSSKRSVGDKIFGVSGAVSAFFGVPVTNLYRDAKGALNTVLNSTSPEATTGAGVSAAVKKEFTTIFGLFDKQTTDGYQLYKAYVDGDTAHYNRVKARYEDEKAAEQALRKELRENDRRIGEAAKARMNGETELYESIVRAIVSEGIFDRNMVIRAVNNEISALERELEKGTLVPEDPDAEETAESLYKASDLNAALERGDRADFELIYDTILGERMEQGKTEAQAKAAVKSSITAYWKKQYLSGYQDTETRKRIIKLLTDTGLYGSRNDVATMCEGWVRASK